MPSADSGSLEQQSRNKQIQLEMIEAQRAVLLAVMDEGTFSSELISSTMANLDADQISLEIKGTPATGH